MKRAFLGFGAFAVLLGIIPSAYADIAQMKEYKKAFPGAAAKCTTCHTAAMPKKGGDVSLNEYGKKAVAIAAKPTAETYTQAGQAA